MSALDGNYMSKTSRQNDWDERSNEINKVSCVCHLVHKLQTFEVQDFKHVLNPVMVQRDHSREVECECEVEERGYGEIEGIFIRFLKR